MTSFCGCQSCSGFLTEWGGPLLILGRAQRRVTRMEGFLGHDL